MLEANIKAYLASVSAVNTLLAGRVYSLAMPQSPTKPALVYRKVSATRPLVHNGSSDLLQTRIQIDLYAKLYADVKTLASAVRNALHGYKGNFGSIVVESIQLLNEIDNYNSEIPEFVVIQDYEFWLQEA